MGCAHADPPRRGRGRSRPSTERHGARGHEGKRARGQESTKARDRGERMDGKLGQLRCVMIVRDDPGKTYPDDEDIIL